MDYPCIKEENCQYRYLMRKKLRKTKLKIRWLRLFWSSKSCPNYIVIDYMNHHVSSFRSKKKKNGMCSMHGLYMTKHVIWQNKKSRRWAPSVENRASFTSRKSNSAEGSHCHYLSTSSVYSLHCLCMINLTHLNLQSPSKLALTSNLMLAQFILTIRLNF